LIRLYFRPDGPLPRVAIEKEIGVTPYDLVKLSIN